MARLHLLAALLLVACTPLPEGPRGACDPLDEGLCALPFPSSFYLAEDAATPTGHRVDFALDSLPVNRDAVPLDPTLWNEKDGFSIGGPILVYFPDVALDGVIGHDDLGAYADADAKTVIVNAGTGERVPHFVELDMSAEDPAERLLMLRPVRPLEFGTRYVVGLRDLVTGAGKPVDTSPAFRALRDDVRTESYDVESRRGHFDEVVFPTLDEAGFPRDDLQLAWDFVTVSREATVGRMELMRDDLLAAVGDEGPDYEVTAVDHDCSDKHIARTLEGTMTVPLYTEQDNAGTLLTRDEDGMPYANGETEVRFVVRIPCSVAADPGPSMVLQYGHGLLGHRDEAKTGWLSDLADREGFVVVATDWLGMSQTDVPAISLMLSSDLSGFGIIPERSHQGYVQQIALTHLVTGALADDPAVQFDGTGVVDPDDVVYYGNSQGGIMGGALMGMSPHLERGVFGVTGGPYNLLLTRSSDFDPFFLIFRNKYDDHREIALLIGAIQMLWDSSESTGWLHDVRQPPAGLPAKQVLLQTAIHDAQVTTLGGHFQARGYDAVTIAPQTRPVFGLEEVEGPWQGNALVEWSYSDVPPEPVENVPPDASQDTHECPRRNPAGQDQVVHFLRDGVIEHFCDGPCTDVQEGCR